ncbi:MAG: hypothetical protein H0W20_05685 [Chthoniobacterales bacterium]|nr:hypothetical protein [Chthoniobacterales bacterium]
MPSSEQSRGSATGRSLLSGAAVAVFLTFAPAGECATWDDPRRGKAPVVATSANDVKLQRSLLALGPGVSPAEAKEVARVSFETGRQLAREWEVVWPPGLQNLLFHRGVKKGGLCFQWAAELAPRLDALKLRTLTLHWAESYLGTSGEHNVIVVTAVGGPFHTGILLDNWRYGGRLAWGRVNEDREYEWKDNSAELAATLRKATQRRPSGMAKK